MKPEILFLIVNNLVTVVWLLMIFAPKWHFTQKIISSFSVVLIVAVAYAILVFSTLGKVDIIDFTSLQGIMKLFHNCDALGASALWYHYLAFDLFVGTWILKDSQRISMQHLIVIPCLFFTFMLGPFGFLLYQIVKLGYSKFSNTEIKSV